MSTLGVGVTADISDLASKFAVANQLYKDSGNNLRSLVRDFVAAGEGAKGSMLPGIEAAAAANQKLGASVAMLRAEMAKQANQSGQSRQAMNQNRMAMMELGGSARSLADMFAAGASPMRAFMMETPRLAQAAANLSGINWAAVGTAAGLVALGVAAVGLVVHLDDVDRQYRRLQTTLNLSGNGNEQIKTLIASMEQLHGVTRNTAEGMIAEFSTLGPMTGRQFQMMAEVSSKLAVILNTDVATAAQKITAMMRGDVSSAFSTAAQMGVYLTANERALADETERLHGKHAALVYILGQVKNKIGDVSELISPMSVATDHLAKSWENFLKIIGNSEPYRVAKEGMASLFEGLASMGDAESQSIDALTKRITTNLLSLGKPDPYTGQTDESLRKQIAEDKKWLDLRLKQQLDANKKMKEAKADGTGTAGGSGDSSDAGNDNQANASDKAEQEVLELYKDQAAAARHVEDAKKAIGVLEDVHKAYLKDNVATAAELDKYDRAHEFAVQKLADAERANERRETRKAPGDSTEVAKWEANLQGIKAAQGTFRQNDLQADLAYWQDIRDHQASTGAQITAVDLKIAEARIKMNDQSASSAFSGMENEIQAAVAGSQKKMDLIKKALEFAKIKFNEQSNEYKKMVREEVTATKEADDQIREIKRNDADTQDQINAMTRANKVENLKAEQAAGTISAKQMAQGEIDAANEAMEADIAAQKRRVDLEKLTASQIDAIDNQIKMIKEKNTQDVLRIQTQAAQEAAAKNKQAADEIASSFSGVVMGYLRGNQTMGQSAVKLAQDLVQYEIEKNFKIIAENIATGAHLVTVDAAKNTAIAGQDAAAATAGKAISTEVASTQIRNDAYVAASGAYAALSSIPYVGPVLGAAAAGVTYAAVMAYEGMASAEGGWEAVPNDQIAQLHKNEMVLPAHVADSVRNMANGKESGMTGGDTHVHIHATDSDSVKRLFMNNGGALMEALKRQQRNFAT